MGLTKTETMVNAKKKVVLRGFKWGICDCSRDSAGARGFLPIVRPSGTLRVSLFYRLS